MPRHAARGSLACVAVLLLAPVLFAAGTRDLHAGVIYLKDGQVLRGYVTQPTEDYIDPVSKESYTIHKGIFLVDDLVRRFLFSHAYVDHAEGRPFDFELGNKLLYPRSKSFPEGKSLPPIREVLDVGTWNLDWDRSYQYRKPGGTVTLSQHMSVLTPHYARIDANCIDPVTGQNNRYPWTSYYRTRELGPDMVTTLLSLHKDLRDEKGLTDDKLADRRFKIFNFLVQANWMGAAEKQLERIKRDFPKKKDEVERATEGIKKLVALDRWDEIKLAQSAGRHETAQKLLAAFPTDSADDQTQAEVRSLRARYDLAGTALKRAKTLLTVLPAQVNGEDGKLFADACTAILAELNLDHFLKKAENEEGRLERFLIQADQSERFAKQKLPHLQPYELLSLAVTSWLMGSASAETKPEAARRVWHGREFASKYQKTTDPAGRAALLKAYDTRSALSVAEMVQVIGTLPPPDPPEKYNRATVEMKAPAVDVGKGTTYTLKLPPEFHPGRRYPVLIALHNGGEVGKDMMERLSDHAGKYGYILAAPDWDRGTGGVYSYSAEEHAGVLDTLRDLRKHFNVDTDRVFLIGYGEGGNMAWDVGLAHPDLFAGVAPISGQPRYHARAYWPNALELPFYCVWGEYMGGPAPVPDKKSNGDLINYEMFKDHWIPSGFPVLGVQYKGRGLEWFAGEVPDIFDWMAQKRRHNPTGKVGFKDSVSKDPDPVDFPAAQRTMRPGDNRFYWLSVEVSDRRLTEARNWNGNAKYATVSARIANGNQLGVYSDGVRQVTVWLARGMIDFDKPLIVRVNYVIRMNGVTIMPSLETLMEDFYQRGDRQRLYIARIDLKG